MTREIALHCMKSATQRESELCEECPIYGETGSDHCYEDALEYVIAMLEQEPVLDKIRADVINIADGKRSMSVRSVVKIIDKYKAESEDKE